MTSGQLGQTCVLDVLVGPLHLLLLHLPALLQLLQRQLLLILAPMR